MRHGAALAGRLSALLAYGLLLAGASGFAPPDSIYLCVDSDGHKTYQNSSDGPACHRVDGIVATIPSSEAARRAPALGPRAGISPASFPRVDVNTQRLRDADRRHILEDELKGEEERLARLQVEFNRGQPQPAANESVGTVAYRDHVQRLFDDIERVQGNIASLHRELTPFRY